MSEMDEAHRQDMETDRLCREAENALEALLERPRIRNTALPGEMEAMLDSLRDIRRQVVATWD